MQDWQSGRFPFTVLYQFENGRLSFIKLELRNNELTYELLGALKGKYGPPEKEQNHPVTSFAI